MQEPIFAPMATPGELVFDVTTKDFENKVLRASMQVPVIVDFWAPWCGPCKQLGPILEKVVREAAGEVLMAKVNLDENQQLAAMMRVQSVPTVYVFFQGQPLDAFQGALPESQVREFIKSIIVTARSARPDALDIPETLKAAALALASQDIALATSLYAQILQQDPENTQSYVGLVRAFIAAGDLEQAEGLINNAPPAIAKDRNFSEAKAALDLARLAPAGPVTELKQAIERNPKDHQARIDLARALFASGDKEEAAEQLLQSITIDRKWNDAAARKELLKFFDAMGQADPITLNARRKLSSILFS